MLGEIRMSKLDIIILDCVNKALDGKQDKLGDYIDPTKEQIIALVLELIGDDIPYNMNNHGSINAKNMLKAELRKKVSEL